MARAARRRPSRNRRRRARPRRTRSLRTRLALVLGAAALCVAAINGAVRARGGGASLLSLSYLPEKVSALGRLALHYPRHLWADPHPPAEPTLRRAAARVGVPGHLAVAMARAESALDPHAISATGAMGLLQLMPGTAREQGVDDPFDTADNAAGGTRYLATLWARYRGDATRTVAAYNAGPGRVPRAGRLPSLPLETRGYVRRVLSGGAPAAPGGL